MDILPVPDLAVFSSRDEADALSSHSPLTEEKEVFGDGTVVCHNVGTLAVLVANLPFLVSMNVQQSRKQLRS